MAAEQAVEQLSTLKGTRELLADGLEQMRVAYEEMSRLREGHGETQAWLANADVWTRKVQTQVKELSAMEPAVERMLEWLHHGPRHARVEAIEVTDLDPTSDEVDNTRSGNRFLIR